MSENIKKYAPMEIDVLLIKTGTDLFFRALKQERVGNIPPVY